MNLSDKEANEILDFIEKMGDLVDLVKRMDRSSGFIDNFQKAIDLSNSTDIHEVRNILLSQNKK